MAEDAFDKYLAEINKAYLQGNATEHTHRPAVYFVNFLYLQFSKLIAFNDGDFGGG
ncbi:MAG: hypothetical protein JW947_11035 [Sedimentisphaerales bacterium]|nr:hypothetical protein [Sedimentisphaerales bacterium]